MANFRLKIAILLRGDRQEWRILGLRYSHLVEGGSAGMANFRLKITILMRRDRQEWRILGLR